MKFKMQLGALVSPCILSPGFQADKKPGIHWGYRFVELLMKHEINVIPLPCPESAFGGYRIGLQRDRHGIDYYKSLKGYDIHCMQLAIQSADIIADMYAGGYQFICILGVEHSPTCAVNYMYSHQGMLKRSGMFLDLFQKELNFRSLEIPQIGINRTYPNKSFALLEQIIWASKEKSK